MISIRLDGYSTEDIVFEWEKSVKRISIASKVRTLPQYNLTEFRTSTRVTQYVVGMYVIMTINDTEIYIIHQFLR